MIDHYTREHLKTIELPFSPFEERERRTRAVRWLGVVLLVGFLLPIVIAFGKDVEVIWLNFKMLAADGVPASVRVTAALPLVAGVALVALSFGAPVMPRGGTMVGLLALQFLIVLSEAGLPRMIPRVLFPAVTSMVLGLLGWLGLFVGSRVRFYRPASRPAWVIGIIGGACYVLYLLFPVSGGGGGKEKIPLFMVFEMFEGSGGKFLAFCLVGQMGCMVAAGVLCVTNTMRRTSDEVHRRAGLAFALIVAGMVVVLVGILGQAMSTEELHGSLWFTFFLMLAKMGCWIGGMVLLLPMGVTDLMVGEPPEHRSVPRATRFPGVPVPYEPQSAGIEVVEPAGFELDAPPADPPTAAPPPDPVRDARLKKLERALHDGHITEEKYRAMRKRVLGEATSGP
ncbi:MAG TPA: hypothetical protein VMY39_07640, partial [Planctomycetota bacterium]|nr:hypothetical protein [Planctomycetota bacterium]